MYIPHNALLLGAGIKDLINDTVLKCFLGGHEVIRMKAEMTGQPEEVIRRDVERDHFMSAKEALEYGIIDEIFDPRAKK